MTPHSSFKDKGETLKFTLILVLLATLIFFLLWDIPALLSRLSRLPLPAITLRDLRGEGVIGYILGYTSLLLMAATQLYNLWRMAWRRRDGRRLWINIHCILSIIASILAFIHSGFPYTLTKPSLYRIRLDRGIKGLRGVAGWAVWLLILTTVNGVLGLYLYRRLSLGGRRISRLYRYWRRTHIILSALLYVAVILHLTLVVFFKHIPAL